MSDLDRLVDEVTIASNKIYLAYEHTPWRPTYYTVSDPLLWTKIRGDLHRFVDTVHAPVHRSPGNCAATIVHWKALPYDLDHIPFSPDLTRGASGGWTVTYENLQIAVHLGLNPIYLIGCDHYYQGEDNVEAEVAVENQGTQNHFIKGYRAPGEMVNPAPIAEMNAALRSAREFADSNGIRIFNATRGGHLEIFERRDFDDLF